MICLRADKVADARGVLAGGRSSKRRLGSAVQAPLQAHHGARGKPAHLAAGVRHQHRGLLLLGCESPSPLRPQPRLDTFAPAALSRGSLHPADERGWLLSVFMVSKVKVVRVADKPPVSIC